MINSQLRPSTSLHESVREEILARIRNGTYQPEAIIPSAAMLGEEFGVSPITIKRALRDLQAAGALVAVAGKGTYVKKRTRVLRRLDITTPSYEGATIQLISVTREKITDPAMMDFEPPTDAMLCVRKIIFAESMPFLYDATYLSSDVGEDILEEFGQYFVTSALERHGIEVVNTDLIIDAAPASGKVEEVFGVPSGYPMLRRFYKYTTSSSAITVFGVVQAPFDQLACSISIPGSPKFRNHGGSHTTLGALPVPLADSRSMD
ncbi:GntR family transcriptional regulator [Sinorhizobium meliloti]|uniref:GntR family transcriptional regulator n=1 Tax=Rhizobium meliloti TaxID=382 RepID=UPI000B49F414|nr:GntR family transcriptional regulator [Sinorhizobium meliloti]ASP87130.1 GntR family transcriptional regulator [Sinorhizobium meliloti]MQW28384.1 GntR family transcriptional regulator [Sinorhizobium meliloti]RVJ66128.1 GntR family transcriptional regulator [Sinorhizobium meliloti]